MILPTTLNKTKNKASLTFCIHMHLKSSTSVITLTPLRINSMKSVFHLRTVKHNNIILYMEAALAYLKIRLE